MTKELIASSQNIIKKKYKYLFENMLSGFALHEMIFDDTGIPIDYIFLDVNSAFEKQTGLKKKDLINKKITDILPEIKNDPIDWIARYGKVAVTGETIHFENFSKPLNKWFSVTAYQLNKGQFATIFNDITYRVRAEDKYKKLFIEKEERVKELECIYSVTQLTYKQKDFSFILQDIVDVLPPAWQYPEMVRAKIIFDGNEYVSQAFKNTPLKQSCEIIVNNESRGVIEVYYQQEHSEGDENLFLIEERTLINNIAKIISESFVRKNAERQITILSKAINQSPVSIMIAGPNGDLEYVNTQFEKLTGYSSSEVIGKNPRFIKSGKTSKALYKQLWQAMTQGKSWSGELQNRKKNGDLFWEYAYFSPVISDSGELQHIMSIKENITDKKKIESNLLSLGQIINESVNEIYIFDKKTLKFTYINHAARTNLGYSLDKILEMHAYDIKPEYNKTSFKKAISSLSKDNKKKLHYKTVHARKDGSQYPVEVHLQLIKKQDTTQYLAFIIDTTEQDKSEAKFQYQAQYDKLTELPNRNLFIDRIYQAIKQSHRSHKKIAILFIDLDRFKSINESLGHEFGDSLLKEIALRLKHCIRETDSIARFGGDEFAIMIDEIDETSAIDDIVTTIIEQVSQVIKLNKQQLYITASIGISIYPNDGETPEVLLRNADSALYKAKDEGRNTFQYYTSEMTSKAFEHILMESNLRKALANHEFIVYYQPQTFGKDNRIFGMEALVRWQHPKLGMISPAKFIPLAEETGLIIPLGEEIFDIATKQIVQWMKDSSTNYRVAINLSVKQLQQTNIVEKLTKILKSNKCSPEWIELEVTEGYVMKNPELAINTLQHFSDMGVEMAIDDFGTGYSSLSYLKRLPINKLKIDQSFVRDLSVDEDDKAIVKSIIYLSKAMNLKVIAEGVETHEQKNFLQKQGCKEIQGYLYSKPVPADEMTKLLDSKFINI